MLCFLIGLLIVSLTSFLSFSLNWRRLPGARILEMGDNDDDGLRFSQCVIGLYASSMSIWENKSKEDGWGLVLFVRIILGEDRGGVGWGEGRCGFAGR